MIKLSMNMKVMTVNRMVTKKTKLKKRGIKIIVAALTIMSDKPRNECEIDDNN